MTEAIVAFMGGLLFQSTSYDCCCTARARNASSRTDWRAVVEAKDVLAAIPPLRGTVVEAEEDILAAMGGVLEGVKPGQKSFCCRKGEGNFDANAAATASETRLWFLRPVFSQAVSIACRVCLEPRPVWFGGPVWLACGLPMIYRQTRVCGMLVYRFYWSVRQW